MHNCVHGVCACTEPEGGGRTRVTSSLVLQVGVFRVIDLKTSIRGGAESPIDFVALVRAPKSDDYDGWPYSLYRVPRDDYELLHVPVMFLP